MYLTARHVVATVPELRVVVKGEGKARVGMSNIP
jgi:hypothetical protein